MKIKALLLFLFIAPMAFAQNMVTFRVNMNEYTGTYTNVNVNGTFNGWCGGCALMADDNADGIYELAVDLASGSQEFKFTLDGWTEQEMFTPGAPCTFTTGAFTNRFTDVTGDVVLDAYCWESCGPCGTTATSVEVTFQVDMNDYTGTFAVVNLNGTFNGWCGGCAPMADDNGDGIYDITVNLLTGATEYKFTVDGWSDDEILTEGLPCTMTTDGFTNRVLDVSVETTLPVVCWESCEACTPSGLNARNRNGFKIFPNPSNGLFVISTDVHPNDIQAMRVFSYTGAIQYQERFSNGLPANFNLSGLQQGLYLIELQSKKGVSTQTLMIGH